MKWIKALGKAFGICVMGSIASLVAIGLQHFFGVRALVVGLALSVVGLVISFATEEGDPDEAD